MANRRNGYVADNVRAAVENLKAEIAAELGIPNYDELDKGNLPARVHGMIGGSMTKRLIEIGQKALAGQDVTQSNLDYQSYVKDMQQDLSNAAETYAQAQVVPLPGAMPAHIAAQANAAMSEASAAQELH